MPTSEHDLHMDSIQGHRRPVAILPVGVDPVVAVGGAVLPLLVLEQHQDSEAPADAKLL
jgi:hypothetical protein